MGLWQAMGLLGLLSLAVVFDWRQRRIPNRLLAPAAVLALALAWLAGGWRGTQGLASALGAGAAVAAVFAPLYLLRQLGGGDLKLLATVGLWVGLPQAVALSLSVAMAGGLQALLWRLRAPGEHKRMPYALAIALGTAAHPWLPMAALAAH